MKYLTIGLGILAVLRGSLDIGGVASFLTYTVQFSKPFNEITAITMQLQLAMASARRVFAVMDEPEQEPEAAGAAVLENAAGAVAFSHVRFAYSPDRPLISDFNLKVEPGTTVAIVGPTGAGKTTLVNLLMRFYEVDGGTIEVDGRGIVTFTRDSLRRSFGMVLQETWLFAGTIRENLAYGRPDATDEEIEAEYDRAAKMYGMDAESLKNYITKEAVADEVKRDKAVKLITESAIAADAAAEPEKKPAKKRSTKKKAEEAPAEEKTEEQGE